MAFLLQEMPAVASPLLSGKLKLLTILCKRKLIRTFRGINEGRMAAREVDLYLEKCTSLPITGGIVKRTAQEIFSQVQVEVKA